MKVLLKKATIIDPNSLYNGSQKDILIEKGIINEIADNILSANTKEIESPNLHVSRGWIDGFADFGDPGHEADENIESGAKAAAAGGFTEVMLIPNTSPTLHAKSTLEYLIKKSEQTPIKVHPIGAITRNTDGKELADMYEMHQAGAVAFSDGHHPVQSSAILLKALQYVLPFKGCIIQTPVDRSLGGGHGQMNEGLTSTRLGLTGRPAFAEELMINRDIEIARYSGSKLHITGISTKKGIELVNKAREEGVAVSCSVTPYHLFFHEEDLAQYDTHLKVNPPLRRKEDMLALQNALQQGQIEGIASHHTPLHPDKKICEFEYAKDGMETLESVFGMVGNLLNESFSIEKLVKLFTVNPINLFNLGNAIIQENEPANLTLFDPKIRYTFTSDMIYSKSKNNAFIGKECNGKVIGIIHKNSLILNPS